MRAGCKLGEARTKSDGVHLGTVKRYRRNQALQRCLDSMISHGMKGPGFETFFRAPGNLEGG